MLDREITASEMAKIYAMMPPKHVVCVENDLYDMLKKMFPDLEAFMDHRITRIKAYRDRTGAGLVEACNVVTKNVLEAAIEELRYYQDLRSKIPIISDEN